MLQPASAAGARRTVDPCQPREADRMSTPKTEPKTEAPRPQRTAVESRADARPYSPGLEGVIAAETAIGFVDGANGRLLYRGFPIGELVDHGSFAQVAELLWTGEWR